MEYNPDAQLDPSQVEDLRGNVSLPTLANILRSVGFTGQSLVTGLAIIMAESSGNARARNSNTNGTTDRGVWQINTVHKQVTDAQADNPLEASKFAYNLSRGGTKWSDWSTYNNGAYLRFMAQANDAANGITGTQGFSLNPLDAVDSITKPFTVLAHGGIWLADRNNWLRIVEVGAGIGLVFFGLAHLAATSSAGKTVISTAKKAAVL